MMERIASDSDRQFYLRTLQPGEALGSPFGGEPFPALVWAAGSTPPEEKARVCAELTASGCRYFVCGGRECVAWETAADDAFIALDLQEPEYDAQFVMTTSHDRQPANDVAFYFANNTSFDSHDFRRYLVLMIGDDPRARAELIASLRAEAAG
jgi:hypothetical protein